MEVLLCEIDGGLLGGMQFRALVDAALRDRGHVVWSVGGGAVLRN